MMKRILISMVLVMYMQVNIAEKIPNLSQPKEAKNSHKIYNEDNKNILVTAKDSTFTITLKSNPTTGFGWFVREYDVNFIKPISHQFLKPKQDLIGAPGAETFVFQVKSDAFIVPLQTVVRLTYTRPFQGADDAKQIMFYVATQ